MMYLASKMTSLGSRNFSFPSFAYLLVTKHNGVNYLRWLSSKSKNFMNHFREDELILWLPSAGDGNTSRSVPSDPYVPYENEFTNNLRSILYNLKSNNDWVYKFEFYLFLNTNDKTKKVEHYYSLDSEIDPDTLSPEEFVRMKLGI